MIRGRPELGRVPAASWCCAVLAVGWAFAATQPTLRAAPKDLLNQWVEAVLRHTPGTADAALQFAWHLTPEDHPTLLGRIYPFVDALAQWPAKQRGSNDIRVLVREVSAETTATHFLERAVVFHADAAMFDHRLPNADGRNGLTMTIVGAAGVTRFSERPALFATAQDGELVGSAPGNWNWPLARDLASRVPVAESEPFLGTWFHATTAYLLVNALFGEVEDHLQAASKDLPDDPMVLFDQGCLAEVLGSSLLQASAVDDRALQTFNQPASRKDPVRRSVDLASPQALHAQAEEFFRRALAAAPHLVEARVRLSNILELEGRHADAAEQAARALSESPPNDLAFYAHLFLARSDAALERLTDAQGQVAAALALYPRADSALIAASHMALVRGDGPQAFSLVNGLLETPLAHRSAITDPWIMYPYGAGRLVVPLLTHLWQTTPAVGGH